MSLLLPTYVCSSLALYSRSNITSSGLCFTFRLGNGLVTRRASAEMTEQEATCESQLENAYIMQLLFVNKNKNYAQHLW